MTVLQTRVMKDKHTNKLIKASTIAAEHGVEHLLIIKHPNGTVKLNGTGSLMGNMFENEALFNHIKTGILNCNGPVVPTTVISYPLLPCSPLSEEWYAKGATKRIRGSLQGMITCAGLGKYGRKLGDGPPPEGWPLQDVPWVTFKGVGNSGLSNQAMTKIIVGLLQAANIDPTTHVMEPQPDQPNNVHEPQEVAQEDVVEENFR